MVRPPRPLARRVFGELAGWAGRDGKLPLCQKGPGAQAQLLTSRQNYEGGRNTGVQPTARVSVGLVFSIGDAERAAFNRLYANPLGFKGVGEIGIVGVSAAVSNAVYHATGRRTRELPIRLEQLIQYILRK